mmetsp:Transcript_39019/g.74752  ORF Transcript_39019/g.74752 Transcript_39019/m.74752 type:complete len:258 (+) Transcript_39019:32-805(+)
MRPGLELPFRETPETESYAEQDGEVFFGGRLFKNTETLDTRVATENGASLAFQNNVPSVQEAQSSTSQADPRSMSQPVKSKPSVTPSSSAEAGSGDRAGQSRLRENRARIPSATRATPKPADARSSRTGAWAAQEVPIDMPETRAQEQLEENPREATRRIVLEDLKVKMMGLEKDPRIVLQVLGIKLEAHPPSDQHLMSGYKKAMIQFHPDRQRQKTGNSSERGDVYNELMNEETFKLVTFHRDTLKAKLEHNTIVA